jgi:hypothetical protein
LIIGLYLSRLKEWELLVVNPQALPFSYSMTCAYKNRWTTRIFR